MGSFLQTQLDFVQWLAEHRFPLLDTFLRFLNFFDTPLFSFLLISFVWVGLHWKWGIRLFYLLIISGALNYLLKQYFAIPRPCDVLPELALVPCRGFSFPSGGAQTSALLAGFLMYSIRKSWAKYLGVLFAFFVGSSRFFLGVHYPSDVVAGYITGALLIGVFAYCHVRLEKAISKKPYFSIALGVLIPLFLMIFFTSKLLYLLVFLLAGNIGIFLSLMGSFYLPYAKNFLESFYRSVVCLGVLIALNKVFPVQKNSSFLLILLSGFTIGLWVSFFSSLTIRALRRFYYWMKHATSQK